MLRKLCGLQRRRKGATERGRGQVLPALAAVGRSSAEKPVLFSAHPLPLALATLLNRDREV